MILSIKDERKLEFITTIYPPIFLNDAKLLFEVGLCSSLLSCEKMYDRYFEFSTYENGISTIFNNVSKIHVS